MISFQNVSIHFGTQDVLRDVSFKINPRERVGIVGPNGAGKSTVFHLITGELSPEKGDVVFEGAKPSIGHLHQQLSKWDEGDTLLSYTMRSSKKIKELEEQITAIEAQISQTEDKQERTRLLNQVGRLQTEFEHLGGYDLETRVKEALGGLGFHTSDFDRPFSEFSGGWKMRAEMVRTLVIKPDVLMLDEPSNYLDLPAVEWMQRFLKEYQGTLLLISHDRFLLRTLTNVTLEIDGQTATRYNGGLDYYMEERVRRYETLLAAKRNQDRIIEQNQRFIDTYRYTASKAPQVQSRVKMLEKMEPIIVPRQASENGKLRLPEFHHCGTTALTVKDAGFSYDGENFVFRNISFDIGRGERVAVVGFNGMGKTTFSRLVSGGATPTEGEVILGHKVVPGYVSQDFAETIPPERSLMNVVKLADDTLSENQCRTLLGSFGFSGDDAFKTAGVLSGGEKIRLAFARMFAQKPNFLVLDEPTTHLDINGRRALEEELKEYPGSMLVVSHDVEFVRNIATTILSITESGFTKYQCGYDDFRAMEAKTRGEAVAVADASASTVTEQKAAPLSQKEKRKLRAEEREKKAPLLRSLRRRVEATEARIAVLEQEQSELVAAMSDASANIDYATINRRMSEIQAELETLNTLWEQAASELAFLEAE